MRNFESWGTPEIPGVTRLGQNNYEFETSLDYVTRPYLNQNTVK